MTTKVVVLDSTGDPIETSEGHKTVEEAQRWCEAKRGEPLEWEEGDRFFSLEGMTKKELEHLDDTAEYPPSRFWICGVDEKGEDRELVDEDFESTNGGA